MRVEVAGSVAHLLLPEEVLPELTGRRDHKDGLPQF